MIILSWLFNTIFIKRGCKFCDFRVYILFDFDKFGKNNSINNSIQTDIDILVKSIEWIKLI
jgi:hypothetical protein